MIDFLVGIVVGGLVVTSIFMTSSQEQELRKKAVEHNCASFVLVDSTSGRTEFHWKEK